MVFNSEHKFYSFRKEIIHVYFTAETPTGLKTKSSVYPKVRYSAFSHSTNVEYLNELANSVFIVE